MWLRNLEGVVAAVVGSILGVVEVLVLVDGATCTDGCTRLNPLLMRELSLRTTGEVDRGVIGALSVVEVLVLVNGAVGTHGCTILHTVLYRLLNLSSGGSEG